jgi:hypothetical protein
MLRGPSNGALGLSIQTVASHRLEAAYDTGTGLRRATTVQDEDARLQVTIRKVEFGVLLVAMMVCCAGMAQKTIPAPVTDSAAQSSPIQPAPPVPPVDAAMQASPITDVPSAHGPALPPHTAIPITLSRGIDSGRLKNGESIAAKLSAPIVLQGGRLAAGTPVEITVVATVPAGKINAVGEFSLQVLRVGSTAVFTDTQTFRGKPGPKDIADAAPAVGTDAGLPSGAPLTFHVQPPPVPADGQPKSGGTSPGSVDGVASGSPPPPGSAGRPGNPSGSGKQNQKTVVPANTTTTPIHGANPNPGTSTSPQ